MGYRRKILEARKVVKNRKKHLDEEVGYVASKRQCWTKVAYPTERAVIDKIYEIADLGRLGLRYYQCPLCELYHISSKALPGQRFVS